MNHTRTCNQISDASRANRRRGNSCASQSRHASAATIKNSIKHGLEPRINGGPVTLRSKLEGDRVRIEVADDGVGIGNRPQSALQRTGNGIGIKNVQERLEVLYGNQARFSVVSNPGRGTVVSIEIPTSIPGAT